MNIFDILIGFVKCFLKGVVEKTSYRKLVANLYFVYSAQNTCYWVFQYHCVCADASIFNQFWNTDPHLAVAHYRHPISSLGPPD